MTKILSIETSCDETSIAVLDFRGERTYRVLSHITLSQANMHAQYGGVYPAMAKREHTKNITPLLFRSLQESGLLQARTKPQTLDSKTRKKLESVLDRDPENLEKIILLAEQYKIPKISAIPVTYGPGLEIALWTGFNIARALCVIWNCDLVPTNHMEGHIVASLIESHKISKGKYKMSKISYPSLALLISGGHTELVLIKDEHQYRIIGQTLDDAVGEAYDKSARLLGFPYPGGVHVSQQAELANVHRGRTSLNLPRPMLHTKDFNFSFSGLKTAVLHETQKHTRMSKQFKQQLCAEFENAVSDVLVRKTGKAIEKYEIKNLIIGGGVSANKRIRTEMTGLAKQHDINLYLPDLSLSGDNALMIGLAGYRRWKTNTYPKRVARVVGNLKL